MIEVTDKLFQDALNAVAATDDGKIVLAMIMDSCGWDRVYMSSDDPQVTQYYAVRRGVYGGLRLKINPKYLKEIEFNYKRKVENDRADRKRTSKPTDKPNR
jgi:hypothetical protein